MYGLSKLHGIADRSSPWKKVDKKLELVVAESYRSPETEHRIAMIHARNAERLARVFAQAAGEVRRLTGLTLQPGVPVDEVALNKALSGQPVERRMRLKSQLFELGLHSA